MDCFLYHRRLSLVFNPSRGRKSIPNFPTFHTWNHRSFLIILCTFRFTCAQFLADPKKNQVHPTRPRYKKYCCFSIFGGMFSGALGQIFGLTRKCQVEILILVLISFLHFRAQLLVDPKIFGLTWIVPGTINTVVCWYQGECFRGRWVRFSGWTENAKWRLECFSN